MEVGVVNNAGTMSMTALQANYASFADGGVPHLLHHHSGNNTHRRVKPVTCWWLHLWAVSRLPVFAEFAEREMGSSLAPHWLGGSYRGVCGIAMLLLQECSARRRCSWQLQLDRALLLVKRHL